MEFRSSPRLPGARPRPRPRVRAALALVAAVGAVGLTACASGSGSGSSTVSPGGSATAGAPGHTPTVNPGGPAQSVSPAPGSPATGTPGGSGTAKSIPATGYSAAGTVLTVYFDAGTCDKYGATADQSHPGEVLVRIVVTQSAPEGQMCPMVIAPQHASVDLGSPLDGRKVVDASDGRTLPPASPMPQGKVTHGPVVQ